jgi:glycosyltransferase involved in cell wall biosynthesis
MMGCPVILSNRCGSYGDEDDVQEGKNGYVFEFGNIEDLAEKIKWLATDDERRKAFADYSHNIGVSFQQKSHFGIIKTLVKEFRKE